MLSSDRESFSSSSSSLRPKSPTSPALVPLRCCEEFGCTQRPKRVFLLLLLLPLLPFFLLFQCVCTHGALLPLGTHAARSLAAAPRRVGARQTERRRWSGCSGLLSGLGAHLSRESSPNGTVLAALHRHLFSSKGRKEKKKEWRETDSNQHGNIFFSMSFLTFRLDIHLTKEIKEGIHFII